MEGSGRYTGRPKPRKHLFWHDGKHLCVGLFDALGTGLFLFLTVGGKRKSVHDFDWLLRLVKVWLQPFVD